MEAQVSGYSLTAHNAPKLRIAPTRIERLKAKVGEVFRRGRGCSLGKTIVALNPILRGWAAYFKLTETKQALEDLDSWIRRKLRCVL